MHKWGYSEDIYYYLIKINIKYLKNKNRFYKNAIRELRKIKINKNKKKITIMLRKMQHNITINREEKKWNKNIFQVLLSIEFISV